MADYNDCLIERHFENGEEEAGQFYPLSKLPENIAASRRQFLKITGLVASTTAFVACGKKGDQYSGTPVVTEEPEGGTDLDNQKKEQITTAHSSTIEALGISKDGVLLASGDWKGVIKVWQLSGKQLIRRINAHTNIINQIVFSPDDTLIASCSDDQTIKLFNSTSGELFGELSGHLAGVRSVVFTPDGKQLISCSLDQTVKIWDLTTKKAIQTLNIARRNLYAVAIKPDGLQIAFGGGEKVVYLWDLKQSKLYRQFGVNGVVRELIWSGEKLYVAIEHKVMVIDTGRRRLGEPSDFMKGEIKSLAILAGDAKSSVIVGDEYGKTVQLTPDLNPVWEPVQRHHDGVTGIVTHQDLIITTSGDKTIKIWQGAVLMGQLIDDQKVLKEVKRQPKAKKTFQLRAHRRVINTLAGSSDGQYLLSGGGVVKVWEMPGGKLLKTLKKTDGVTTLAVHPLKPVVAIARAKRGDILFYNYKTGDKIGALKERWIDRLTYSPDGNYLLVEGKMAFTILRGSDGVKLFTFKKRQQNITPRRRGPGVKYQTALFSKDGKQLILGDQRGGITLIDLKRGKPVQTAQLGSGWGITAMILSDDGRFLAVARGKTFYMVAMKGLKLIRISPESKKRIDMLFFTKDQRFLVTGYREIKVWQMPMGRFIGGVEYSENKKYRFLMSGPEGNFLLGGVVDGTVHIWNINTGKEVKRWQGLKGTSTAFYAPDGTWIAIATRSGKIEIRGMPTGEIITGLFDPDALKSDRKASVYTRKNSDGITISYAAPCGTPIPGGSICTCNCVPGGYVVPKRVRSGGKIRFSIPTCSCNTICTCVPIK